MSNAFAKDRFSIFFSTIFLSVEKCKSSYCHMKNASCLIESLLFIQAWCNDVEHTCGQWHYRLQVYIIYTYHENYAEFWTIVLKHWEWKRWNTSVTTRNVFFFFTFCSRRLQLLYSCIEPSIENYSKIIFAVFWISFYWMRSLLAPETKMIRKMIVWKYYGRILCISCSAYAFHTILIIWQNMKPKTS